MLIKKIVLLVCLIGVLINSFTYNDVIAEGRIDYYDLNDVIYEKGKYISVGDRGNIKISKNGEEWVKVNSNTEYNINSIIFHDNQFIAVGDNGIILTSTDGENWDNLEVKFPCNLKDITYGNGKFVAVGEPNNQHNYEGIILTSQDGITWIKKDSSEKTNLTSITWNGEIFVAVGAFDGSSYPHGEILTSRDGVTWLKRLDEEYEKVTFFDVIWGGDKFVAVGGNVMVGGKVFTSPDGINWTKEDPDTHYQLQDVEYINGNYIVSGIFGTITTSKDGKGWKAFNVGNDSWFYGLATNGEKYILVGRDGDRLSLSGVHLTTLEANREHFVGYESKIEAKFINLYYDEPRNIEIEFYIDSIKEENLIGSGITQVSKFGEEGSVNINWTPEKIRQAKIIAKIKSEDKNREGNTLDTYVNVFKVSRIKESLNNYKEDEPKFLSIRGIVTSLSKNPYYEASIIKDGEYSLEFSGYGANDLEVGSEVIVQGKTDKVNNKLEMVLSNIELIGQSDKIKNSDGSIAAIKDDDSITTIFSKDVIDNKINELYDSDKMIEINISKYNPRKHDIIIEKDGIELIRNRELSVKISLRDFTFTIPCEILKSKDSEDFNIDISLVKYDEKYSIIEKTNIDNMSIISPRLPLINIDLRWGDEDIDIKNEKIFFEIDLNKFYDPNTEESNNIIPTNNNFIFESRTKYLRHLLSPTINPRVIGIYNLDDDMINWEYNKSSYNYDDNKVRAYVDDLDNILVLDYNTRFNDIKNNWAEDYIEVLEFNNIASGISENKFSPKKSVTRAQFVTFLVRALSLNKSEYRGVYIDCPKDAWYVEYVEAGDNIGLVRGIGDNRFNPNGEITREEMTVFIMRAYDYINKEKRLDDTTLTKNQFKDDDSISSWALKDVYRAKKIGIISGMMDGNFNPKGKSLREQSAKVIVKLLEVTGKL